MTSNSVHTTALYVAFATKKLVCGGGGGPNSTPPKLPRMGWGAPQVSATEDGLGGVEDPAAPGGALGVVLRGHKLQRPQQPAQQRRQHHAVAPRARVARVHHVPVALHLQRQAPSPCGLNACARRPLHSSLHGRQWHQIASFIHHYMDNSGTKLLHSFITTWTTVAPNCFIHSVWCALLVRVYLSSCDAPLKQIRHGLSFSKCTTGHWGHFICRPYMASYSSNDIACPPNFLSGQTRSCSLMMQQLALLLCSPPEIKPRAGISLAVSSVLDAC
jgi:hypothetical protein